MKCRNCNHEMLIEEKFLSYWIKWICPKCNWQYTQKLNKGVSQND